MLGDMCLAILIATLILLVVYYIYATSYHGVWKKLGIPGPKPWPILDHMPELRHGLEPALDKWFKEYGKTFGVYGVLPHSATLITKDLSLMKHVLVKDFDNFTNRFRPRRTWSSITHGLSSTGGSVWKRHRQVTSPMFTVMKMKIMLNHVCASAQNLTKLARQHSVNGQLIPLKAFAGKFSTEVIARVGFGVETHAVSTEESEFAYYCRNIVALDSPLQKFVSTACHFFPPAESIMQFLGFKVDFVDEEADNYFVSILKSTMQDRMKETRKNGGEFHKARDMLDLLMDACVADNDARLLDSTSKTLSKEEVIGNSTLLILAGVETVSTAFQSLLYCLALNPDIQERVIEEIDHVGPADQNIDYDQLSDLKYTEQVINECLRLFPLITSIFRIANETKIYDGITIPKGSAIQIPIGKIMRDPEIWPDPENFDPDRFSPENKTSRDPLAFLPFGYGPRVCLGQRLAMMELKVILVCLFQQMRFTLSERTAPKKGETLKMKNLGIFAIRPAKPIELEVVLRERTGAEVETKTISSLEQQGN